MFTKGNQSQPALGKTEIRKYFAAGGGKREAAVYRILYLNASKLH